MLFYDRINISEGNDVAKSNNIYEFIICHYWFFNYGFEFQNYVCNGWHDFTTLCLNLSDVAITAINGVNYSCIIYNISKSEATHFLENSVFEDHEYV